METSNVVILSQHEKEKLHDKFIAVCDKMNGCAELRDGYYIVNIKKWKIKQKDIKS